MKLNSKYGFMQERLDLEHIQFQYDRKELVEAEDIMQAIISDYDEGYGSNDKVISKKVTMLSEKLSAIVGYNVSISLAPGSNFYTYIIPTKVQNDVLLGGVDEIINYYDKLDTDGSSSENYNKKEDTIDSMLKKAYDTMNRTLNTTGLKIDLDKGKVSGLDKDFNQMIFVDFGMVIDKYKLSARECLGALMHEIGHTFMYFVHLRYTASNVSLIIDTIKNDYIAKGKDSREVLNLIYSKMTNTKTLDAEAKSITTIVLDIGRELMTNKSGVGRKDVEFTADVFAARFGFGEELTSALLKMTGMKGRDKNDSFFWRNTGVFFLTTSVIALYIVMFILSVILAASGVGSVLGVYLLIFSTELFTIFLESSASTFKGWSQDPNSRYNNADYDNMYDRVNRIRQQLIMGIKNIESIPNDKARSIIAQIDSIAKMSEAMKHRRKLTDKIKAVFSKKYDRIDFNYAVEDLLSSNLNVAYARLKSI